MIAILPALLLGLLTAQEPVKKGPEGREIFKRPQTQGQTTKEGSQSIEKAGKTIEQGTDDAKSVDEPSEETVSSTESEIEEAESEHRRREAKIERIRKIAKDSGDPALERKAEELSKKNRELHGQKLEKVREKHGDKAFEKAHRKMNEKLAKSGKGEAMGLVAVCHAPPGNPGNRKVIHVSESAVDAHLKHGDTLGDCGATQTGSQGGGPAIDSQKKPAKKVETERVKGKTERIGDGGGFKRPGGSGGGTTEAPDGSGVETEGAKKGSKKEKPERVKGKKDEKTKEKGQ